MNSRAAALLQSYPKNMVPDRGAAKVDVEVCVAVLHPHQTVLLHERLGEEGVVRPVVLHPGHPLSHVRHLHQLRHPSEAIGREALMLAAASFSVIHTSDRASPGHSAQKAEEKRRNCVIFKTITIEFRIRSSDKHPPALI